MDNKFENDEKLYRAVLPKPIFWRKDGKVSSAAFKDKNGLSVERGNNRKDMEVVNNMKKSFFGDFVYVTVGSCKECNSIVKYFPSSRSIYHSEIHRNENIKLLTQSQAKYLADNAIVCNET